MNKDIIKLLIVEYQKDIVGVSLFERSYAIEDTRNYVFVET